MVEQEQIPRKDFFISYTGADRLWAEWVAWQLEEAGYSFLFQESFPAGQNFVQEIKTALEKTNNTLAILSPDYVDALSMSDEWSEALSIDPSGLQRSLIPVQVRETRNRLRSVLSLLSYVDLVDLDERRAHVVLLEGISRVSSGSVSSSLHTLVTVKQPRFPGSIPPIWNVPYPRNPFFTGREVLLTQLAETLQDRKIMSLAQPQAISGLGGIGKTQLALEYTYRYRQNYEAVFWVIADSRESLVAGYTDIARQLELPQYSEHDQSLTILAVKQWLQRHLKWLLILDNADDLEMVREFLPSAPLGHIILTTRAFSMGSLAVRLNVNTLTPDEGSLFLLRRADLIKSDTALHEVDPDAAAQARALVEELGGLPLALDQVGAYIEETGCSLSDYAKLYRAQRSKLLRRRGRSFVSDHPDPVATTWALAFQKIAHSNLTAVELLQLCAFLASDDIPEELIISGAPDLRPALKSIVDEPIVLNDAIATLLQYSLVRRNSSQKTLSIHRLVQAVLLDAMDEVDVRQWAERAVRIVNRAFPSGEFETWSQCERLLPHALRCTDWVDHYQLFFPEVIHLLNRTGYYLSKRARYQEADILWQRALVDSEQLLGPSHLDTATSLNNLAQLYREQGRYREAEPLYERALAIREQQLGTEHPYTAISLGNLGSLYREQGRYKEAEPLYERALAIREQQLGAEHPDTAISLNNLAQLYNAQGRYEEAEPLYERALRISEEQLGEEHPNTALSVNNLAYLYQAQGKYEEAEPLYERALAIREQRLGAEHPDTAISLDNLAQLYDAQGRYEEAEPLYERALAIREQQLGGAHPDTAISLNNLAQLYNAQGKYEEARSLYERALAVFEQQLGAEHPYTAISLGNLGSLYREQGRYKEAEPLYKRALAIREQQLGGAHPDTAISLNSLARLYDEQGGYKEAGPLYQRALAIFEQRLGSEHPYTAMVRQNLASLYQKENQKNKEMMMHQPALSDQQESSNQEHMEASDM